MNESTYILIGFIASIITYYAGYLIGYIGKRENKKLEKNAVEEIANELNIKMPEELQMLAIKTKIGLLKQTKKDYKKDLIVIFKCLIKENRKENGAIKDTIYIEDGYTLWDFLAGCLEIDGEQHEIEEKVLKM